MNRSAKRSRSHSPCGMEPAPEPLCKQDKDQSKRFRRLNACADIVVNSSGAFLLSGGNYVDLTSTSSTQLTTNAADQVNSSPESFASTTVDSPGNDSWVICEGLYRGDTIDSRLLNWFDKRVAAIESEPYNESFNGCWWMNIQIRPPFQFLCWIAWWK